MTSGEPVLFSLEQVTVRRGGALLLDQVTCQILAGTCTALTGPSGSGKTTVLRLLNRLDEPGSVRGRLDGRPLPDLDVHPRNALMSARGPTLPGQPEDPDNANPARQPGLQHVRGEKRKFSRSRAGPTSDPPWS